MSKVLPSRRQQEVKARESSAVSLWNELRSENPDAKKDRIADTIAQQMKLTKAGVYQILKRAGIKEFQ